MRLTTRQCSECRRPLGHNNHSGCCVRCRNLRRCLICGGPCPAGTRRCGGCEQVLINIEDAHTYGKSMRAHPPHTLLEARLSRYEARAATNADLFQGEGDELCLS